jgi:hypothetical protein
LICSGSKWSALRQFVDTPVLPVACAWFWICVLKSVLRFRGSTDLTIFFPAPLLGGFAVRFMPLTSSSARAKKSRAALRGDMVQKTVASRPLPWRLVSQEQ